MISPQDRGKITSLFFFTYYGFDHTKRKPDIYLKVKKRWDIWKPWLATDIAKFLLCCGLLFQHETKEGDIF